MSCRRIFRKVLKQARKEAALSNCGKFLPLGYAKVSIFKKNLRRRKLENYGLGLELIGSLEIERIRQIQVPGIIG